MSDFLSWVIDLIVLSIVIMILAATVGAAIVQTHYKWDRQRSDFAGAFAALVVTSVWMALAIVGAFRVLVNWKDGW